MARESKGVSRRAVFLALGTLLLVVAAKTQADGGGRSPLSPEKEQRLIRLESGLRLELIAAEPQVESPVAIAFDEDGRLWVVEMLDYPNGPAKGKPPEGRIKILEDRDGDGRYEHCHVFADHLLFANGLMPWRGGVLVTAAPNVVYLRDTDDDGRADEHIVLFEGFAAENPQLRVNHPVLGLDNWIYVSNGLRGGQVRRSGSRAKPVNLSGMDFRFDLIHDRYEAVSGMGQYGNTFDDWGRRFVCDNHDHLRHIVLANRYIKRNPYLAVPQVLEDTSVLGQGPLGSGGKIYPLSKNWTTSNLHAGRFTAACGVHIYRGSLLPEAYRGDAFTCDPTGNLIHREILRPSGATFRSRPAEEGSEFVASPEDWFRPVNLYDGPDGALYVVDMYRAVIEHPEYMPTELKTRPDLTLGKDRGRIWRIVPDGPTAKPARPRLSEASLLELVALLEHPDGWWRTTAQRLLWERQYRAADEPLRKLCLASERPQARLHAAWLLDGLGALDEKTTLALLKDGHPRVREQAVMLGESRLGKSAAIRDRILALAADPDAQVRFQVALSLGEWDDPQVVPPLTKIALAGLTDHWTRTAVASSVPRRAGGLLGHLMKSPDRAALASESGAALLQELAAVVGARRDTEEVAHVLDAVRGLAGKDGVRLPLAVLNGLADGMGRRGTQLGTFLQGLPAGQRSAAAAAEELLQQAATLAAETKRSQAERLPAIRLLAHASWTTAEPVLKRLLTDDPVQEVRLAAVRALAGQPRPEVGPLLMQSWRAYTPGLRREVTEAMFRQPDRLRLFLHELEAGRVKPGDLDPARIRQLVNYRQPEIRAQARKLLQDSLPPERKEVLARYRPALQMPGDAKRGQAVFQKNCATCHRIGGIGVQVGPDISDTRTKTPEALFEDILNPNKAIDNNFINYLVTTKSGKVLTGIITVETASSVTLQRAENQTDVVLRQDIEEIQSTGQSLMPDGLEKNITVPELADLIAFLKNWRYLDGSVPLGDGTATGK